jgi:hypothetical protein
MIHVATTSGVEIIRTGMVDVAAESARRLTGTATVEMDTIAPVTRSQMALDYAREELSLNGEVLLLHDGERERDVGLRELEATVAYALRSGAPGAAISDDEVQSMAECVLASGCRTTAGEQVLRHVMDRLALFASCVAVVDKTGEALHSAAGAGAVELRPSIECGATKEREVWVRVRVPLIFHIFSTSGACGALAEDAPMAVCCARFEQHFLFAPLGAAAARCDGDGPVGDRSVNVATKSLCEVYCEVSEVRPTRVRVRHALRSAAASGGGTGRGKGTGFLLCTVTFYANRAHNLTRSP